MQHATYGATTNQEACEQASGRFRAAVEGVAPHWLAKGGTCWGALPSHRATGVWERLTAACSPLTADPTLELRLLLERDNSLLTQKKRISIEIPRRNASTRLGSDEGIEISILKV